MIDFCELTDIVSPDANCKLAKALRTDSNGVKCKIDNNKNMHRSTRAENCFASSIFQRIVTNNMSQSAPSDENKNRAEFFARFRCFEARSSQSHLYLRAAAAAAVAACKQ